jgi:hypothetical protein
VVPLGAMEILCGDEVLIFYCLDIHLDGMCTHLHIIVSPDGLITNWYYGVLAYFFVTHLWHKNKMIRYMDDFALLIE